jgi:hypothetical protein
VILHPAVVALLAGSGLGAALLLFATGHGVAILRRWDLASGSSLQLSLERRTYLVSTLVGLVLAFELVSLLLFVRTADALAPLFTGAMCAAGTLAVNAWGYPALLLRLLVAVLAGLWLVVNHADNLGHDYPLIRTKYALLLGLAPLFLLEAWLQARFFAGLSPEVITSCCGSLFSSGGAGAGALLAALPPRVAGSALYVSSGVAVAAGAAFLVTGRSGAAVALAVTAALAASAGVVGLVSFVSPYVYELPAHRCPFCLLQAEYRWIGYPLYAALLAGAIAGVGAGALAPFRRHASLAATLPSLQRRLAQAAVILFGAFGAISALLVLTSRLRT